MLTLYMKLLWALLITDERRKDESSEGPQEGVGAGAADATQRNVLEGSKSSDSVDTVLTAADVTIQQQQQL